MKTRLHGQARGARQLLGAVLVLIVLAAPTLRSAPAAAARSVDEAPLDLAAAVLTPADLAAEGLAGYSVADGDTRSPEAVVAAFAFQRGVPDDEARALLAETGLMQAYELRLDLPAESGDGVAASVISTIHEYADEEGAAAAFAILSDWGDSETAEVVEADETIGDASILTRHHGTTPDPYHALDLTFQFGHVTAIVRLVDLTSDDPAVADVERLAGRLLERIDAEIVERATGVAALALRVMSERAVPISDYYLVRDDEARPTLGESAEDFAAHAEELAEAGLTDEFMVRQTITTWSLLLGDIYFYSYVQRFSDEAAASDYLRGEPARQAERDDFDDFAAIEGLAEFGDESVAYTQTYHWGSRDVDLVYQTYYLRVGDLLAMVMLIWPEAPPLAALEGLAAAQAACLEAGVCAEPVPLPAALLPIVESPDGEDTEATGRMADAALPDTRTWTDPSGDVELTYDPAAWEAAPEHVLMEGEELMLVEAGGKSTVGFSIFAGTQDVDACIEERFARLARAEALGEARQMTDESGEPVMGGDADRAFAAYGVRLDDGTNTFLYLECRAFADGESVLVITHVAPLDRYDARGPAREALLDGLVLSDA